MITSHYSSGTSTKLIKKQGSVQRNLPLVQQVLNSDSLLYYSYANDSIRYMERGQKRYELSNHLGNVLAVVSDRKLVHCSNDELMWFDAQVVSVSDYYPFGMEIKERSWSVSSYRYGFNGKEKDSETFDGAIAFEARIYDSRIGRFLSTDPREAEYAWQSTYAYFSNCPIAIIDHLGMGGEDDKKVKKGEGPAAFAERNGTSLDELAASNPNVFENYPASDEAKKKEYWSNTSGKDWMIHEGQKLNVAVKQDANNFIGPRLADGSTERKIEESANKNYLSKYYQGVVQGGDNLRKSIEFVINSTVDGDFGPLMSIIQFPGGMQMNTGENVGVNLPSTPEEFGEATFSIFTAVLTKGRNGKYKNGPEFSKLKDHARRHGGLHPNKYYNNAVDHTRNSQFTFKVTHNGTTKVNHISKLKNGNYMFTSRNVSGTRIFTHMDDVNENHLLRKGITLPKN